MLRIAGPRALVWKVPHWTLFLIFSRVKLFYPQTGKKIIYQIVKWLYKNCPSWKQIHTQVSFTQVCSVTLSNNRFYLVEYCVIRYSLEMYKCMLQIISRNPVEILKKSIESQVWRESVMHVSPLSSLLLKLSKTTNINKQIN